MNSLGQSLFYVKMNFYFKFIKYTFYLGFSSKPIGIDDEDKVLESIKILNDRDSEIEKIYLKECSKSLNEMLAAKVDEESSNKKVSHRQSL